MPSLALRPAGLFVDGRNFWRGSGVYQDVEYTLEWLEFDWTENRLNDARIVERRTLAAKTEEGAKLEAAEIWRGLSECQAKQWDGKVYPREPRLRAEIPWSPDD